MCALKKNCVKFKRIKLKIIVSRIIIPQKQYVFYILIHEFLLLCCKIIYQNKYILLKMKKCIIIFSF